MMLRKFSLLSFLFAAPLCAQTATTPTWFTVVYGDQQNPAVVVSLPAGTTYRIGDTVNNKWEQYTVSVAIGRGGLRRWQARRPCRSRSRHAEGI